MSQAPAKENRMIRITWVLQGGPHVIDDVAPAAGCVIEHDPEDKKPPVVRTFPHGMSARVRKATAEEVEQWRAQ